MANCTAQSIMEKATLILQDPTPGIRWLDAELLGWLNDGQKDIVREKPDANPVVSSMVLAAGSQQTLAAGKIQLLDVTCNMGTNGSTRGNLITVVEPKILNAVNPGWMVATANTVVVNVVYDPKRAPKLFWVSPPSTGTNYIEIITADLPADVTAKANPINLTDEYATILMHYILAMAFAKDAEDPNSVNRASMHYNIYLTMLMGREAREQEINPIKVRGRS